MCLQLLRLLSIVSNINVTKGKFDTVHMFQFALYREFYPSSSMLENVAKLL